MENTRSNEYGKGYEGEYSESGFLKFVRNFAKKFPGIREAVAMFYCLKDSDTPVWVKGIIVGVLGYLICPVDAVPDPIPVIGLLDDLGVLAGAYAIIRTHIKDEHWAMADELLG